MTVTEVRGHGKQKGRRSACSADRRRRSRGLPGPHASEEVLGLRWRADRAAARAMRPHPLVWLATLCFAVVFGALSVLRHRAFGSGRFDLGNMTHGLSGRRRTATSLGLTSTGSRSRGWARTSTRSSSCSPLWWLWPSPELLLVVQAGGVALGALPVYWLARAHLDDERPALALARVSPLPAGAVADRERLPPGRARMPLLLFAWWFLDERRLVPFAFCAAARYREEARRARRCGNGGLGTRSATGRRAPVSRSPALAVRSRWSPRSSSSRTSPRRARRRSRPLRRSHARRPRPPLPRRAAPAARAAPAPAPLALVAALPELALNLLSSTVTQPRSRPHTRRLRPGATRGDGLWRREDRAGATRRRRPSSAIVLGPIGGVDVDAGPHGAAARQALAAVPDGRAVSATNSSRAPVGPAADLQLPDSPRRRVGGRRHPPADLPRQPEAGACVAGTGSLRRDPAGASCSPRRVLVFRRR